MEQVYDKGRLPFLMLPVNTEQSNSQFGVAQQFLDQYVYVLWLADLVPRPSPTSKWHGLRARSIFKVKADGITRRRRKAHVTDVLHHGLFKGN